MSLVRDNIMKLIALRVQNYRSVNDSGEIEIRDRTALVGRNESGKTNLLLALCELCPPTRQFKELSFVKDFPRDRTRDEFTMDLPVAWTKWELSSTESQELTSVFPRAAGVTHVTVSRPYAARRDVEFIGLTPLTINMTFIESVIDKGETPFQYSLKAFEPEHQTALQQARTALLRSLRINSNNPFQWLESVKSALQEFQTSCSAASFVLPDDTSASLAELQAYLLETESDPSLYQNAKDWVLTSMPIFVFIDDYPVLPGHQNIVQYNQRRRDSNPMTDAETNFQKLLKVAGLDANELETLLGKNHEERQLHTNRASAAVTKKVRQLWSDRQLKVRFHLDADHFDTLISDPTSFFDVEVNLDERSRGFKWFFHFMSHSQLILRAKVQRMPFYFWMNQAYFCTALPKKIC